LKIVIGNGAGIKRKTTAVAAFLGDSAGYSLNQNRCCGNVTVWLAISFQNIPNDPLTPQIKLQ
jgi:hypothetical protein